MKIYILITLILVVLITALVMGWLPVVNAHNNALEAIR